jgi:PKD repeat protein
MTTIAICVLLLTIPQGSAQNPCGTEPIEDETTIISSCHVSLEPESNRLDVFNQWGFDGTDEDEREDTGKGNFKVNPTKSIYEVFYGEELRVKVEITNEADYTATQDIKFWVGGESPSQQETLVGSVEDLELGEYETTTVVFGYDVPEESQRNWPSEDEFDIRVTATGGGGSMGLTDSTWRSVDVKEVEVPPPSAEFSYSPDPPRIDTAIRFDASDSFSPTGSVQSYEWEMGDGTENSGVSFKHKYEDYGEYEVSLTVSDGENEDTVTKTVVIQNTPPEPVVGVDTSLNNLTVEDSVVVDATDSYDPDGGRIREYRWEFGDGTSMREPVARHSYDEPGSYNMTLTVGDGISTSSKSVQAEVINRQPMASFEHSPDEDIVTGKRITFNASESYNPDGEIEEFRWEFGNGEKARGEIVKQSYEELGTYDVVLTVDDGIDTDEEELTITVGPGGESADGFGVILALFSLSVVALLVRGLRE